MTQQEFVSAAAQLVVEEGLDFRSAKAKARKQLRLPERTPLPSNEELDAAVREHIALFHAETQPHELASLRRIALDWMKRLHVFRPHLTGAVWNGTATRHSDIHLQLFCDDTKSAEIELINQGHPYETHTRHGFHGGEVDVLTLVTAPFGGPRSSATPRRPSAAGTYTAASHWTRVLIHLDIHDLDDLRGALKPDARGQVPRGSLDAVKALVQQNVDSLNVEHD